MEEQPVAPAEAPAAPESENNTSTSTPEPAPATPDMHGFTSDELADMRKFYDSVGGYEKVKSRISNPQKYAETAPEPQPQMQPQPQPQPTQQQQYIPPKGAITAEEFLAQQYFQSLSRDPKYETISDQIASGDVLKEMAAFDIRPLNVDGSINDAMVRRYLDLKAQTVPAKPTNVEPNASSAPTVTYTEVGDGGITSIDQAYKILMEPGNPGSQKAEEYIRNFYNPGASKKQ